MIKVSLPGTNLSETDLRRLTDLEDLEELSIPAAGVTDDGMEYIARFENLRELNISNNRKITEKGLKELKSLKKLRLLEVFGCDGIPPSALEELHKKLPDLRISGKDY